MSDGTPDGAALQFDKAEFSSPQPESLSCKGCAAVLDDTYYEINGNLVCPSCKERVEKDFEGGSKLRRFLKSLVVGSVVAALGSAIWFAVRALTNYELGLLSVVIGIGVGKAVNWGSGGRGGWPYQALAVFLTYTAVAMTYVPLVIGQFMMPDPSAQVAAAGGAAAGSAQAGAPAPAGLPGETATTGEGSAGESAQAAGAAAATQSTQELDSAAAASTPVPAGVGLVLFGLFVIGFSYALPFLGGADNILGLLIIGFGLWEAWRYNKRGTLAIVGPLKVRRQEEPAAPQTTPPETAANG